jgi:hypothetical protein
MASHKYSVFFKLFGMVFLSYFVHKCCFIYFEINPQLFKCPLEVLYAAFSSFALLFTIVLKWVKTKNFDQMGMAFLWGSMLKFIAFWFYKNFFFSEEKTILFEKNNLLILFVLFLAIETIVAISLLSKKD